MTEKQQQLTFEKGITNVPSDITCSDNALAESIGMIYDDGEHRVIQKPEEFITSGTIPTILYIHKFGSGTRYIGYNSSNVMCWGTVSDKTYTTPQGGGTFTGLIYTSGTKVSSVGKTLIISDNNGLHYYLWKEDSYEIVDYPVSKIDFNAYLKPFRITIGSGTLVLSASNTLNHEGILDGDGNDMVVIDGKQEDYNTLVAGLYSKNLKIVSQKKGFCRPFLIRLALELYDGSFLNISQPFLLFPTVTDNSYIGLFTGPNNQTTLYTHYLKLYITQLTDYTKYSDIVKDVVVFASAPIPIYDTSVDQPHTLVRQNEVYFNYICRQGQNGESNNYSKYDEWKQTSTGATMYKCLAKREEQEIISDITSTSIFYKLCSIGLKPVTDLDIASKLDTHTLENLTTQQRIETDDYFSHCKLTPDCIYAYNSRLNLANVKRSFFEGFDRFIGWENTSGSDYDIYVTIKTDVKDVVIKHTTQDVSNKQGIWFFYPDSRASHVVIKSSGTTILDAKLTECEGLNGAYYFAGLPSNNGPTPDTSGGGSTSESTDKEEALPNRIITSEANNPFIFKAEGYYTVGTGEIKAMSTITQALSEGQFGQFPLLVFSESGIWALSVASTGYYSSAHPISREVCNNAISITQTDGAVFFTSNKGLMVVVGSQVKCVSEQLSGHTLSFPIGGTEQIVDLGNFLTYMASCYVAYDYRDSLLWIFNQSYNYCYVYSIKSGTFSKYSFDKGIKNVVNNYPDYLLQNSDKTVYSLTERPDINADYASGTNFNRYAATMLTRPMKLENALALKTIMKVNHIEHFTTSDVVNGGTTTPLKASLTFRLFASNNLENWVELKSLTGVPWKYYRFRYDFANLKATDRFAGSVIITQERRTNKLR